MNSLEARDILSQYRPGDTNHLDPRMAEALELARKDPQLAVWFGQHCAAHVKIPETEIIPAPKPVEAVPEKSKGDEHVIPLNKPALFMIGVAILIVVSMYLWKSYHPMPESDFAGFRDREARLVQRAFPVKIMLNDQTRIRQYFRTNGGAYDFTIPPKLEKLPGAGAAVFTWRGQPVSLMGMEAGANTNFYLFLIKKTAFADQPIPGATPQYSRVGRLMTASWTQGNNIYLLTGPNDSNLLQNFLAVSP